jgi:2-polyprenyl-3-methyl-5-hydroxy-6-metoxy-1,4-benzoquinol methylase
VRLRDILAVPAAYRAFDAFIGSRSARTVFVRDYVRPRPGDRVLDIGCGPGSMVPYLADVDYVGFDSSPEYIASARASFPGARFLCERVSDTVLNGESFDVVLASGVLHHLNDAEALELLRLAHARVRAGGRLVTIDPCFVAAQSAAARWLIRRDRGRFVRSSDAQLRLMQSVFRDLRAVVRHDLLRIPYTHFITECTRR